MKVKSNYLVGVIMGSKSDWKGTMEHCSETLKELPSQGIKNVHIISPGFSADCLETLEELEVENREYFEKAGGKKYLYIPCLNDSEDTIDLLESLILENNK